MKILELKVELPIPYQKSNTTFGFDPGTVHLGLAKIYPPHNYAVLYEVEMERDDDPIQRALNVQRMLDSCVGWLGYYPEAIIEGPAYGYPYRQVELAENRIVAGLWFHKYGVRVKFVGPHSIRKKVFGDAKVIDRWENLPDNAAAALACAYY